MTKSHQYPHKTQKLTGLQSGKSNITHRFSDGYQIKTLNLSTKRYKKASSPTQKKSEYQIKLKFNVIYKVFFIH